MKKLVEVYEELLQAHYKKKRFETSRFLYQVEMNWRNHIAPTFAEADVTAIDAVAIYKWHLNFEENPYAGNRSKSLLSKLFSYAELKGYRSPGSNPCAPVPNHPEVRRRRYASQAEIEKIGKILAREEKKHPREVAFIYVLMFTGARPSAVERFTWNSVQEIRVEGVSYSVIRVDGKTGEEFVVIPPGIFHFIKSLRVKGRLLGISFPRHFWRKVRDEAGCPDLWARDWRRTFGVTGLSQGVSEGAIGQLLNHKNIQTTKRYTDLYLESRIKAANLVSNQLGGAFGSLLLRKLSGEP